MRVMDFNWEDYLYLAQALKNLNSFDSLEALLDKCGDEACLRSAVSRAYYATYCFARNYAIENLQFTRRDNPSDHWRLRTKFKDKGFPDIASDLDEMRQWRNNCDYEDKVSNLPNICESAIEDAQEVLNHLI